MLLAALTTAERALPLYSHRHSPKKFTQHQLLACLVLKSFLKTDYRGVVAHLADCPLFLLLGTWCWGASRIWRAWIRGKASREYVGKFA